MAINSSGISSWTERIFSVTSETFNSQKNTFTLLSVPAVLTIFVERLTDEAVALFLLSIPTRRISDCNQKEREENQTRLLAILTEILLNRPFHMKMGPSCNLILMQIQVISIRIVSHLDSSSNRGTRELGNRLLTPNSP